MSFTSVSWDVQLTSATGRFTDDLVNFYMAYTKKNKTKVRVFDFPMTFAALGMHHVKNLGSTVRR